jgi:hypothetical protein
MKPSQIQDFQLTNNLDNLDNLGLRIQDLNLSKISGPIGGSLMVPKENVIAPIVLMLGERHMEVKNGCPNIDANEQIDHLLEKLNTITVRDNFDTQFYAEMFLNREISNKIKESQDETYINTEFETDYNNKNISTTGLLSMVSKPFKACYYNEIRKKYPELFKQKCKYPNIKWQYNDVRGFLYNNQSTIANIDLLDDAVCNLIVYLAPLSRFYSPDELNNKIEKLNKRIKQWEGRINEPQMIESAKKERDELINRNPDIIVKDFFGMLGLKKGKIRDQMIQVRTDEYREVSISFNNFVDTLELVPLFYLKQFDVIIDKLFFEAEIFKKQIKIKEQQYINNIKINFEKYLNYWYDRLSTNPVYGKVNDYVINLLILIIEFLKTIDDNDITMNGNDVVYSENIHRNFQVIIDYINSRNIDDYINKDGEKDFMYGGVGYLRDDFFVHKNYKTICELIQLETFTKPCSIILDMYFILRIFKYEITKPTLVCCLIGNAHKTNIAEYFKITGDYDVFNFKRMSKNSDTPLFQCVDTISNVTEITDNDKIINNFSIDLYDLLKHQDTLIIQKQQRLNEYSNEGLLINDSLNPFVRQDEDMEGGYKKTRSNRRQKVKSKRRKTKQLKIMKTKKTKTKIRKSRKR